MSEKELDGFEEKKENWFLRTTFKLGIFGSAFLAFNKVKGPAKTILYDIFKNIFLMLNREDKFRL